MSPKRVVGQADKQTVTYEEHQIIKQIVREALKPFVAEVQAFRAQVMNTQAIVKGEASFDSLMPGLNKSAKKYQARTKAHVARDRRAKDLAHAVVVRLNQ